MNVLVTGADRGLGEALCLAYHARGDDKKTEEYLKKSADRNKTYEAALKLGDFLTSRKRYKEAAEVFATCAKRANGPQDIDVDDDALYLLNEHSPALPTYLQGRALVLAGESTEGKRLIDAVWSLERDAARRYVVEAIAAVRTSAEGQEGVKAFLEKRKPKWAENE